MSYDEMIKYIYDHFFVVSDSNGIITYVDNGFIKQFYR
jgi:hypothetical protein